MSKDLTKLKRVPVKRVTNPLIRAINQGPLNGPNGVSVRVKRVIHENLRNSRPEDNTVVTKNRKSGPTFMSLVREALKAQVTLKDGRVTTKSIAAAETFADMMVTGEIAFVKEFIEREEGKVSQDTNTEITVKQYIGMPVDDQTGAP